jgi:hypothetical protein
MNDAATVTGTPAATYVVEGREYRFHPLTFQDHGELQAWLDRQQPDPFGILERVLAARSFPIEVQKFLARSALELASRHRVLLGTPEADALLGSTEGQVMQAWLSLRHGDPSLTLERAREVLVRIGALARSRALASAGVLTAAGEEDPSDPKAPPAPGPASPAATSRSTGSESTTCS